MNLKRFVLCLAVSGLVLTSVMPGRAADDEYRIGVPDILKIVVWGQDDLSRDYQVEPDGAVSFPLIGRVKAVGTTTTELAARLRDLLGKDYLVNPQVIVSVKEYLSQKAYVVGEVDKAGVYYLTGPTTVLDVISRAGGLSSKAGRELLLVRKPKSNGASTLKGTSIIHLDFSKIQAGNLAENVPVQDDDTIFIPRGQAFFVLGEVKSAGTFPLDKPTSVLEAITLAGGFNEKAAPSAVKIIRRNPDGQEQNISLDLSGGIPRDREFQIKDGDSILVPRGNTFFVFGEVRNPGAYQLDRPTTILEGITIAGGFTGKAAPARTRVIRNTPKGQQTIEVDMNDIVKRGHRDKAIPLQENDVVVVPESFF